MCGRYHLTVDEAFIKEIKDIVYDINIELINMDKEIYPSNLVPILCQRNGKIQLDLLHWGFSGFNSSKLIINARSESIFEKKLFQDGIQSRRALIPCSHFYEWDSNQYKHSFSHKDKKILLLAGLYNNSGQFVIVTTSANDSVKKIHHRMPVIIEESQIKTWLLEYEGIQEILSQVPVSLNCNSKYYQLTLDL